MMSVSLDMSFQLFFQKRSNRLFAILVIRKMDPSRIPLLFILIKIVRSHYVWIASKSAKSTTLVWSIGQYSHSIENAHLEIIYVGFSLRTRTTMTDAPSARKRRK